MKRVIAIILLVGASLSCFGWGGYEHGVIAYASQFHLTEKAQTHLRYYLDQPIYEYSEWMDYIPVQEYEEYRQIAKFGHVVAVGLNGELPGYSPFENGQAACYPCLKEVISTLENHRNLPDSLVILNLRYLIHMVGDMHCPGHILYVSIPADGRLLPSSEWKDNRIWKKCWYKGSRQTIHWLWDTALQHEHPGWTFQQWKEVLDTWDSSAIKEATSGTIEDWIKDCASRCDSIFEYSKPDAVYDESYYGEKALELSHLQIRLAIYRLASILNSCFDYE